MQSGEYSDIHGSWREHWHDTAQYKLEVFVVMEEYGDSEINGASGREMALAIERTA